MKHSNFKKIGKKQSGFTLIELLTVVVILGILAYVSMSAFSGSPNAANATAIRSGAMELSKGVGYINANIGTGIKTTPANNPLIYTGNTMLDVLVVGSVAVGDDYKSKYAAIAMRPLETEFRITKRGSKGVEGEYTLLNYPVTMVDTCPANKVCTVFKKVTKPVLDEILIRYGLEKTDAKTDIEKATTQDDPVVFQVDAAAQDTYTVKFALIP